MSHILVKAAISLKLCVRVCVLRVSVFIKDAIVSLFFHSYPLLRFAPVTLRGKTNLHTIDLLIMQNEIEVRLLRSAVFFSVRFFFFCPCPAFSALSVSPSITVWKWINCDPGLFTKHLEVYQKVFSGQGLQGRYWLSLLCFAWPKLPTQPCLHQGGVTLWLTGSYGGFPNRIWVSDPHFSTTPPHCNRFRLIRCLFVILCTMQLLKLPGLCSNERGDREDEMGYVCSCPKCFSFPALSSLPGKKKKNKRYSLQYSH